MITCNYAHKYEADVCLMVVQCVILGEYPLAVLISFWQADNCILQSSFNQLELGQLLQSCNFIHSLQQSENEGWTANTHYCTNYSSNLRLNVLIEDSSQSHNFSIISTDLHLLPNTVTYSLVIHLMLLSKATYCTSIKWHIFAQGHNDGWTLMVFDPANFHYQPRY